MPGSVFGIEVRLKGEANVILEGVTLTSNQYALLEMQNLKTTLEMKLSPCIHAETLQTKEKHAGELLRWNVSTFAPCTAVQMSKGAWLTPHVFCLAISESSADLSESYNLLQRGLVSPTAGLWLLDANE